MSDFTPVDAGRALADAIRWQDTLVRRTEGMTWIVWGMAVPAMILSMGYVGLRGLPAWAIPLAWLPWLAAAFAFTSVIWRTAWLARPDIRRPTLLGYVTKGAAIAAGLVVLHFVLRPQGMAWPLVLIGAAWVAVALFGLGLSRPGRWTAIVVGAVILAVGSVLGLVPMATHAQMLVAAAATGLPPVAAGLARALG